jgi:hypothetical protein
LKSIFSRQIYLLYFVKGKFGGKKLTLQESESTLQSSFWRLTIPVFGKLSQKRHLVQ